MNASISHLQRIHHDCNLHVVPAYRVQSIQCTYGQTDDLLQRHPLLVGIGFLTGFGVYDGRKLSALLGAGYNFKAKIEASERMGQGAHGNKVYSCFGNPPQIFEGYSSGGLRFEPVLYSLDSFA